MRVPWLALLLAAAGAGCSTKSGFDFFTPSDAQFDFPRYMPPDGAMPDGAVPDGSVRQDGGAATDLAGGQDGGGGAVDAAACGDGFTAADGGGCAPVAPHGPIVSFVSPAAGALVVGQTLTVTVQATRRPMAPIVQFVDLVVDGTTIGTRMALTATVDTYAGTITISSLPTGPFKLVAIATDLSGDTGTATRTVTRDAGPLIQVYLPQPITYRGQTAVLFSVANPTTDPQFDVDVTATAALVQKVPVALTRVAGQLPPTWTGNINFHDSAFGPPLAGPQLLHITARNIRGTEAQLDAPFIVDEVGPVITFVTPRPGNFVAGVLAIEVSIQDVSGVDPQSVLAVFGGDLTYSLLLTHPPMVSSDQFEGIFDTRLLPFAFVNPVLSVRAVDGLGNQSEESEEIVIDNVPPAIDLDPPEDMHVQRQGDLACSRPFDPVGSDAADDGDVVLQLSWLRARIEDRGNRATGQTLELVSRVDPVGTTLAVVRAADAPVIVDTDGDGYCDNLNPELVPSTSITMPKEALLVPLVRIPVQGAADFVAGGSRRACTMDTDCPPGELCTHDACFLGDQVCRMWGTVTDFPPHAVCPGSPITYDLGYLGLGIEPAIWSIAPTAGLTCQGLQFDSFNRVPDGPLCVAVKAMDRVGNYTVSRPLRLCLDKQDLGTVCDPTLYQAHDSGVAPGHALLPDCTGTVVNGVVDGTRPCMPGVKLNTRDASGNFVLETPYLPMSPMYPVP